MRVIQNIINIFNYVGSLLVVQCKTKTLTIEKHHLILISLG